MAVLEEKQAHISTPMSLSVIGCVVNGPGEALYTDVGFTGGGDFEEGLGHAMQAKRVKLVVGRMFEQDCFS